MEPASEVAERWLCSGCDEAHTADALNELPSLLPLLRGRGCCTVACVCLHTRVLSAFVGCFQQTRSCFVPPPLLWGRNHIGGSGGSLGPGCCCSSPSASERFPSVAAPGWGSRRVVGAGRQARGGTRRNHPFCSRGERLNGKWEQEGHWQLSSLYDQRFG